MEILVRAGLSNALWGTALALAAAALTRRLRHPSLVHGLWLVVLLKLLFPPVVPITLPRPAPEAAGRPAAQGRPERPIELAQGGSEPKDPSPAEKPAYLPVVPTEPTGAPRESTGQTQTPASPGRSSWQLIVAAVWLTGSAGWLTLAVRRWLQFGRLLRFGRPAPAALRAESDALAARLGLRRPPAVWLIPGRVSPMLWALAGAPRVLLPAELWHRLDPARRRCLLAHELAHLRRGDHWVRRLELVVLALYWWLPTAWWARRRLHEASEECCDACVLSTLPGAGRTYAEALVDVVAFLSRARMTLPAGASGAGPVRPLKRRLVMILQGTVTRPGRAGRWAVLALGAALLPLWALPGTAHPPAPPAPDVPASPAAAEPPDEDDTGLTEAERTDQIRKERDALRKWAAEMRAMRARLKSLQDQIRQSQARLARLEGRPEAASEVPGAAVSPAPAAPAIPPAAPAPAGEHSPRRPGAASSRTPSPVPTPPAGVPHPVPLAGLPGGPPEAPVTLPPPVALPAGPHTPPAGADYERRLQALERKLDRLIKQMEQVRRPDGPGASR